MIYLEDLIDEMLGKRVPMESQREKYNRLQKERAMGMAPQHSWMTKGEHHEDTYGTTERPRSAHEARFLRRAHANEAHIYEYLTQDKWWRDSSGEVRLISSLDPQHQWNLKKYLMHHSLRFKRSTILHIDQALNSAFLMQDEEDRLNRVKDAIAKQAPGVWIRGTQLYERLHELVPKEPVQDDPDVKKLVHLKHDLETSRFTTKYLKRQIKELEKRRPDLI